MVAKSESVGNPALFIADYGSKVGLCSDEAQSEIERAQPYNTRPAPESDLLWQVHELDRVDKDQLLNVIAIRLALKPGEDAALYLDGKLVENPAEFLLALAPNTTGGAEFGAVGVTESELEEYLHNMLTIGLVFGAETPAAGAAVEALWPIHDHCQALLEPFEPFLS